MSTNSFTDQFKRDAFVQVEDRGRPRRCPLRHMPIHHNGAPRKVRYEERQEAKRSGIGVRIDVEKKHLWTDAYKQLTVTAEATGPENSSPEKRYPSLLTMVPVHSPPRITPENNGKIRPQPDRENAFAGASGGSIERLTTVNRDAHQGIMNIINKTKTTNYRLATELM